MQATMSRKSFIKGAGALAASAALTGTASALADEAVDGTDEGQAWDYEVDFLVVGTGTAAFGALAASEVEGAKVMVIEKHETMFGGTSVTSGAGFWIPNSYCQEAEGIEDSPEAAISYITGVSGGRSDDAVIAAYVENAPKWLQWATDETGCQFAIGGAQDYYDGVEGFLQYARNAKLQGPASELWGAVQSLLVERGVDIQMGCALTALVTDGAGNVIGVEAEQGGRPVRIKATSVLLGTGGFDYDPQMMHDHISHPVYLSNATTCNTGDGHKAAAAIGARMALMDTYWGVPFFYPGTPDSFDPTAETAFSAQGTDWNTYRGKPNSIVVNAQGRRFNDEATAYAPFVRPYGSFSTATMSYANTVAYFICDSNFFQSSNLPGMSDDNPEPNEWFVKADTLEDLANQLGIDPEGLADEVEKFNGYAADGYDPDFHRGEKASGIQIFARSVDRPELANPLLGPIDTPPFYGALYLGGTCGTSGGMKINEHGQVLSVGGAVIGGLYACGNCTAAITGNGYCGGGGTLGPGAVMAYVGARHALGVA